MRFVAVVGNGVVARVAVERDVICAAVDEVIAVVAAVDRDIRAVIFNGVGARAARDCGFVAVSVAVGVPAVGDRIVAVAAVDRDIRAVIVNGIVAVAAAYGRVIAAAVEAAVFNVIVAAESLNRRVVESVA